MKKMTTSILAVFAAISTGESPVIAEMVATGTPTDPNAVGIELTTRHPTTTGTGSIHSAIRIPAGIATAVPHPAIPSIKWPNPHAIRRNSGLSAERITLFDAYTPDQNNEQAPKELHDSRHAASLYAKVFVIKKA